MKKILKMLANVVHEIQRERGSAALYIGSDAKLFNARLRKQIKKTDKTLACLTAEKDLWKKQPAIKPAYIDKIANQLARAKDLTVIRKSVINCDIPLAQTFNFYSHQMIGPLLQIMIEIACFSQEYNHESVSAFNSFLQWKERVGLERGIGTRGFIKASFLNDEFLERFLFLLSEQKTYKKTFLTLASTAQQNLLAPLTSSSAVQKLDRFYKVLYEKSDSELLRQTTPEEWFDLLSKKIDTLHEIEIKLIDTLETTTHIQPTAVVQYDGLFGKYHDFITSLQLFSNLSANSVQQILSSSKIMAFSKNKMIFQEGEQADKLFIILKGWIKIYKVSYEGEETIVQMLSSGDTVLEPFIFLNTVFSVSGQAIEDVLALSIPATVLNEKMQKDNKLTLNFISNISHSSMHLVRQIKSIRLKNSNERIGWFLLKLHIDQGINKKSIRLPYKKSLIASYLGMTGETFSRGLNKLKQQGFEIKSKEVTLPIQTELCQYCDFEMAGKCEKYNARICKYEIGSV